MSIEKFSGKFTKEKLGVTILLTETLQSIKCPMSLGVYCYLASKPDDWRINVKELTSHFAKNKDTVLKYLNHLISIGLLFRTVVKSNGKIVAHEYELRLAVTQPTPLPQPKKPDLEKPALENQDTYKAENKQSIELTKKNTTPAGGGGGKKKDAKIWEYLDIWNQDMAGMPIGLNGGKHHPIKILTNDLKGIVNSWINAGLKTEDLKDYFDYLKQYCYSRAFEPRVQDCRKNTYPKFETFCRLGNYERQTRHNNFIKYKQENNYE